MSKSEKAKLQGQELINRLIGISTPADGISWKPSVNERGKAQRLLVYLADQRALHYPYDKEIESFVSQSILDIHERLTCDIKDLSEDSILKQIMRGMQAVCQKFLDENQSPSAGYGWPYKAQLYCTLGELRALLGIYVARIAYLYDLEVDVFLEDILPPELEPEPDKSRNANSGNSDGS